MTIQRLYRTLRMLMFNSPKKRADWLREKKIFHHIGQKCEINIKMLPLYPELISFGDNVNVASEVMFLTHDGINNQINKAGSEKKSKEGLGCIQVGNNVSFAARVIVNHGVKIGDNVVITAGSVVTHDIPSNSIARGNPAEVACTMKQYQRLRALKKTYPDELAPVMGVSISDELINWMWEDFEKTHN